MTEGTFTSCMYQDIFHRGLPTETVSLYLLCCGLVDAGLSATRSAIAERWNAGDDQLAKSLEILMAEGILSANVGPQSPEPEFTVVAPKYWRPQA